MRIDKLINMLKDIQKEHGLIDVMLADEFNGTDEPVEDIVFVEANSIFDDSYAKIT